MVHDFLLYIVVRKEGWLLVSFGDRVMKNWNIIKNLSMFAVIIIAVTCCNTHNVLAHDNALEIDSKIYQIEDKNDFEIDNKNADSSISSIGKLNISGSVKKGEEKDGIPSFIVTDNQADIYYEFDSTILQASESEWNFTDIKNKSLDGNKLTSDLLSGGIIVQTSLTGDNWINDKEYTDVFDANISDLSNIYQANDVQLQNGCYYRILVAYRQQRVNGKKKVPIIKIDNKETRCIVEEYIFYAECNDKGQMTSANTSPKVIYGKKNDVSTAVYTGKDEGYSLSKAESVLSSDDPQYGWALGYFTVNGYTSDVKDKDGNYVFLKNVGDQVTLWFTLEKDINDLLGDGRLSIAEDKKGKDLDFQISETNFKHGALIISYIDSENGSREPVKYFDYLAANARTGADTKVTLFEEGDYEVALDYKIKNEPRKVGSIAIAPTYSNYKVFFKFSIRNGNCMAYPFDITTGSELRDGDISEDGFTLKLAGSKYNDISMRWDVIVGEEGQKRVDKRKDSTANDGGTYTEEGIYTFSVKNEYTGVTTTKTIYVGTDPYIKALSKTGRSLSEINDKIQQGYEIHEDGSIILPVKEEVIEEDKEALENDIEEITEEKQIQEEKKSSEDKKVEQVEEDVVDIAGVDNSVDETKYDKEIPLIPVVVGAVLLCIGAYNIGKGKKSRIKDSIPDPEEEENEK